MITDQKLIRRADAFVKGLDADEQHPDLAALMRSYANQRDRGSDLGAQAHARSLLRLASQLGVDEPKQARPAKKSTRRRR